MVKRQTKAIVGSALFLVVAPGMVAGVIPYCIGGWQMRDGTPWWLQAFGAVLAGLGGIGLLDSFARFAREGLGTPAPVYPTERLVVSGLYRYARNPMYSGVVSAILGQALVLGNVRLLLYGLGVWAVFHLFVLLYEEPELRSRYGAEYGRYRAAVPRWIPRTRAWRDRSDLC